MLSNGELIALVWAKALAKDKTVILSNEELMAWAKALGSRGVNSQWKRKTLVTDVFVKLYLIPESKAKELGVYDLWNLWIKLKKEIAENRELYYDSPRIVRKETN